MCFEALKLLQDHRDNDVLEFQQDGEDLFKLVKWGQQYPHAFQGPGKNLLLSEGQRWFRHRRLLTPSGTNTYIKAVHELSCLVDLQERTILYYNDLIFYLSPHGFRLRKACKVADSHTGNRIGILVFGIHRNPTVWENPGVN